MGITFDLAIPFPGIYTRGKTGTWAEMCSRGYFTSSATCDN